MLENSEAPVNTIDAFCERLKVMVQNYYDDVELIKITKAFDEIIETDTEAEAKEQLTPLLKKLFEDNVIPADQITLRMRHAGLADLVEPA